MRAKRHIRHYFVETARGFLETTVTLQKATSGAGVVLAKVRPPFCTVVAREPARSQLGEHRVQETRLQTGEVRFECDLALERPTDVSWGYRVSASVPLHPTEFARWPADIAIRENVDRHEFARRYECQIESEGLQIDWEFDQPIPGVTPFIVVEDYIAQTQSWRRDPQAEKGRGCRLQEKAHGRRWALVVRNPRIGRRYAIGFRFIPSGAGEVERAIALGERLTAQCRGESNGVEASIVRSLSERVVREVEKKLEASLDPTTACLGLLWQQSRYKLLTAFGRFPNEQWGVRFGFGDGVAGHAFRFASSATYSLKETDSSLLYAHRPSSKRFEWVVCLPLRFDIDGPLLGVLSIAGANAGGSAERRLSALAQQAAAHEPDALNELSDLAFAVNFAFWEVLIERASDLGLPGGELETARRSAAALAEKIRTTAGLSGADGGSTQVPAQAGRKWSTVGAGSLGAIALAVLGGVAGWSKVEAAVLGWFDEPSAGLSSSRGPQDAPAHIELSPPASANEPRAHSAAAPIATVDHTRIPAFARGLVTLEITTVDSTVEAEDVVRKLQAKAPRTGWSFNLVTRSVTAAGRLRYEVLIESVDPRAGTAFCDWLAAQGWSKPKYACELRQ